jgi:hypothetical protein
MKKMLVSLGLLLSVITVAKAETIATLNNKAGGKIVLTDRPCIHKGVTHDRLNFVYNYDNSGYSSEGCWGIEGEVVSVVWFDSQGTMRYPLVNFVINPNYKGKNRNRSTM